MCDAGVHCAGYRAPRLSPWADIIGRVAGAIERPVSTWRPGIPPLVSDTGVSVGCGCRVSDPYVVGAAARRWPGQGGLSEVTLSRLAW